MCEYILILLGEKKPKL